MSEEGARALTSYVAEELRPGDHVLLLYERPEKMWEIAGSFLRSRPPKTACFLTPDAEAMARKALADRGVDFNRLAFADGSEFYARVRDGDWEGVMRGVGELVRTEARSFLGNVLSRLFRDGFVEQCLELEARWGEVRGAEEAVSMCIYDSAVFSPKRHHEPLVELIKLHDVIVFPGVAIRR